MRGTRGALLGGPGGFVRGTRGALLGGPGGLC